MKATFSETDGQVGSTMEFESKKSGTGRLEILEVVPNQLVKIKLTMLKPFHAENLIEYRLTTEAEGTRFTWSMSGKNGFIGKLISVLFDCEKMVAEPFSIGINNLKNLIENQAKTANN